MGEKKGEISANELVVELHVRFAAEPGSLETNPSTLRYAGGGRAQLPCRPQSKCRLIVANGLGSRRFATVDVAQGNLLEIGAVKRVQLGRKRKASRNWELGYLEPYRDGQGFGSMGVHGSARG